MYLLARTARVILLIALLRIRRTLPDIAKRGLVIPDISDSWVHLMCRHLGSLVWAKEVNRGTFGVGSIKPSVVVGWLQDHRHSVMYRRGEFVRIGGDDAEALEPISGRRVFPAVP
jgi:hypothetical protein